MRFTDSPVIELSIGSTLLQFQQDNGSMHVGTSVWPCSLVLAKFVERWVLPNPRGPSGPSGPNGPDPDPYSSVLVFNNKRGIELGSGCGPAGMALSLMGLTDITLTDIAPVMPALKRNLKRNKPSLGRTLKTAQLYWNNSKHIESLNPPFDFVVAADVVYIEETVHHLVSAMSALVDPSGFVLLGYQIRSPEAHRLFWDLCDAQFLIHKVPHDHLHPDYAYEETDVYILRKKPSVPL